MAAAAASGAKDGCHVELGLTYSPYEVLTVEQFEKIKKKKLLIKSNQGDMAAAAASAAKDGCHYVELGLTYSPYEVLTVEQVENAYQAKLAELKAADYDDATAADRLLKLQTCYKQVKRHIEVKMRNPWGVLGLPYYSELLDEEIENAYQAKLAQLEAADYASDEAADRHSKLQTAYEFIKQKGKQLKRMREWNRELDDALIKAGLYGRLEQDRARRPVPTRDPIFERGIRRKLFELYCHKSQRGAQEQARSSNNSSCCSPGQR